MTSYIVILIVVHQIELILFDAFPEFFETPGHDQLDFFAQHFRQVLCQGLKRLLSFLGRAPWKHTHFEFGQRLNTIKYND
jgi:hypothetical protein